MLDPPPLVEHLIGQVLLQGELCTAGLLRRHKDLSDIPHRGPDFGAFLSVKPFIPLSQELEEVLVLIGQIQHHESLSRDVKHMNPNEGVKHPACSWSLDTLAFLVRKRRVVLLERAADAIL